MSPSLNHVELVLVHGELPSVATRIDYGEGQPEQPQQALVLVRHLVVARHQHDGRARAPKRRQHEMIAAPEKAVVRNVARVPIAPLHQRTLQATVKLLVEDDGP